MRLLTVAPVVLGAVLARNHERQQPSSTATTSPSTLQYFETGWQPIGDVALDQQHSYIWNYEGPPDLDLKIVPDIHLLLCQTNATQNGVTANNTWFVEEIGGDTCLSGSSCQVKPGDTAKFTLFPHGENQTYYLNNFFLCFGNISSSASICQSYSPFFNIDPEDAASSAATTTPMPAKRTQNQPPPPPTIANTLTITATSSVVGTAPPTSTPPGFTSTSLIATVTVPSIAVATPTEALSSDSSSKSSGGLPLGAKIGIALGGLVFLLVLLLLALFCLRRHHSKRSSRSEQVMLTTANANDSHDLVAEKETRESFNLHHRDTDTTESFSLDPSPTGSGAPVLPVPTRFSALSPYETLNSRPYTGDAASIPRRKTPPRDPSPAAAPASGLTRAVSEASQRLSRTLSRSNNQAPALTRTVSGVSAVSRVSDRTIDVPPSEFEAYRDIPSHLFWATPTSFLDSETSRAVSTVSSDERAKLDEEEEERRIDAAIAEAERRKRGVS